MLLFNDDDDGDDDITFPFFLISLFHYLFQMMSDATVNVQLIIQV